MSLGQTRIPCAGIETNLIPRILLQGEYFRYYFVSPNLSSLNLSLPNPSLPNVVVRPIQKKMLLS